jgi:integrase
MRGTIRKDIGKNGKVTYNYLVYKGADEEGNKKYKRKRGFEKESECEDAMIEAIYQLRKGVSVSDEKITVGAYLDKWMKAYVHSNCKHTTIKRYETFVKQIKEYIGVIKLAKLSPLTIQEFYTDLQEDRGISNNTLIKTHRMLHEALKQAQKWQLIYTNPADLVTLPKEEPIKMKFWDPDMLNDYLDLVKGTPFYNIIFLAVHTGLRQAEICGLGYEDIDFINKTLHVQNSVQRYNGKLVLDSLKTKNSNRVITLYDSVIQLLKAMKKKDKELKLKTKRKEDKLDPNFVFHWDDVTAIGNMDTKKEFKCYRPMDPHYISEQFPTIIKSIVDEDGEQLIPSIRFHDLRHTHATMLRKLGVDTKVISERLGHSDVAFTLKTYTHVNVDMQRNEMSKVEDFLK